MLLDASGRKFVTISSSIALFVLANSLLVPMRATLGEVISLKTSPHGGCRQVQIRLKAEGKLIADGEDSKRHLPIRVKGQLEYVQIHRQAATLRHYRIADAEIVADGRKSDSRLSSTRRLIAVDRSDGGFVLYSPFGPLTRDDLEMVETQCDPLALEGLLPEQSVRDGATWAPSASNIAHVLGWDVVTKSSLTCKLSKVNAKTAKIEVAGELEGASLGAKSRVAVEGTIAFDRRVRRIADSKFKIDERREVGYFSPGCEMEATIESTISAADPPAELSPAKLRGIQLQRTAGNTAIDFTSPGLGLAFLHDRRWRVTLHRRDLLILRMVDEGEFIAQCNIAPLRPALEEQPVELAKFRAQIEQALSQQEGQILEASQATTDEGLAILRIAAAGKVNDVPVTWYHYLLTRDNTHRAAVIFTLAEKQNKEFGAADHDLIGSLRFLNGAETAQSGGAAQPR